MRFAFYGRVSTEDQQDPDASREWQLHRARLLIDPQGGEIVRQFFDLGHSRSKPWSRRPAATELLEALRDTNRGFSAVVVGEPQRAFYGSQYSLVSPLFNEYGVGLWVPEVGGPIDFENDGHDAIMQAFAGMSRAERNRIKIRVRSAMAAQTALDGRWQGGRPPYGYLLADVSPHPKPAKAALGKMLRRLVPDPIAAPVVRRIFEEYVGGSGLYRIAERLTADGIPSPSAHDPRRNKHRLKSNGAWSKSAIGAILRNPRYTGRQYWARTRKEEVLFVSNAKTEADVAQGHKTRQRANAKEDWIFSKDVVHEPLISPELFDQAQDVARVRPAKSVAGRVARRKHPYALRGLIECGMCERRMQGTWERQAYYRCAFPYEYAQRVRPDHMKRVYLREAAVLPELDRWLAKVFNPKNIDETIEALSTVADIDASIAQSRIGAARERLAECDRRLGKYRETLDAGGDPAVIASWIRDVENERLLAQRELSRYAPQERPGSDEVRELLRALREPLKLLGRADSEKRNELYSGMGLALRYEPEERKVLVEVAPSLAVLRVRVGGGI